VETIDIEVELISRNLFSDTAPHCDEAMSKVWRLFAKYFSTQKLERAEK
jgi:hypothetical protein